jgi:hypothetical protein
MGTSDSKPPTGDERRAAARHLACFPVYVGGEEAPANIALIRDISVKGALLLTRERFAVGDRVELAMYVSGDASNEPEPVGATVVRSERRSPEQSDLWLYAAAVSFDEEQSTLEEEIRSLEASQKKLGLHRE